MVRLCCTVLAGWMILGLSQAQATPKKAKGVAAHGRFVSFDHGKLTITNKRQGDKSFEVAPGIPAHLWHRGEEQPQKLTAKEALKNLGPKDRIVVHLGEGGKVVGLGVNPPRKAKRKKKAA